MLDTTATLAPAAAKAPDLLRFITCGSVDDGKSTLIGRLLYDSKSVFEDQLSSLDKDSKKFGTQGDNLDFALLVDGLAAEREQGITIDVAYRYFQTPRRAFIVADTPGHEQYTRNMATGASTAELAIILVDARKGILPQTRRHSFIVSMLGVKHIVLAINKMDLVDFSQDTFRKIAAFYEGVASDLGFESILAIPLSARDGDNMAQKSERTPWYQGPSLLDYLETVDVAPARAKTERFRFPVQWVNRPNLDFRGFSGWVAEGAITPGTAVKALPSGRTSKVTRIVTFDGDLPRAAAGQAVTLTLADEVDVSRGDVLVAADDPLGPRAQVTARLLWMSETPMPQGGRYRVKVGTAEANAEIAGIDHVLDIHTFEKTQAQALAMNGIGLAVVNFDKPLVVAPYADNRDLGGFILIDRISHETVAMGVIVADSTQTKPKPRSLWDSLLIRPQVSAARSAWKALSWVVLASLVTFAVVYGLSGEARLAGIIVAVEAVVKGVLYYGHERLWARLPFGLGKRPNVKHD